MIKNAARALGRRYWRGRLNRLVNANKPHVAPSSFFQPIQVISPYLYGSLNLAAPEHVYRNVGFGIGYGDALRLKTDNPLPPTHDRSRSNHRMIQTMPSQTGSMFSKFVDPAIKSGHMGVTKGFAARCTRPIAAQTEMVQIPSWPQTEITSEQANLNTILALTCEWLKKAIHVDGQAGDFGLLCGTQFPGGGEAW